MKKTTFSAVKGLFFMVLFFTFFINPSKAAAAENLPKVGVVSLDHFPFVEGDQNQFFIASKGYAGEVQYQLFYICESNMKKWKMIETENMVNGWTKPTLGTEVVQVDLSQLNMKADYYRFAIRVRRVGVPGKFKNSYGDYDDAYPFTITVAKTAPLDLNHSMRLDQERFTQEDWLSIDGIVGVPEDTEYKLHFYDVKNNKWITNVTEYDTYAGASLENLENGTYIVDLWCKTPGSKQKYDGWKLKTITVQDKKTTLQEQGYLLEATQTQSEVNGEIEYAVDYHLKYINQSGKTQWEKVIPNLPQAELDVASPYVVADNTVYVVVQGELYAFDLQTGKEKWNPVNVGMNISAPVVDKDGTIYCAGYFGPTLTAVSPEGKIKWEKNEEIMMPYKLYLEGEELYLYYEEGDSYDVFYAVYDKAGNFLKSNASERTEDGDDEEGEADIGDYALWLVQEGTFDRYPDEVIYEGFESFFDNTTWTYFMSTEEKHIVEFTGECYSNGEIVTVTLQFTVEVEQDRFDLTYYGIGEESFSHEDMIDLLDVIFAE